MRRRAAAIKCFAIYPLPEISYYCDHISASPADKLSVVAARTLEPARRERQGARTVLPSRRLAGDLLWRGRSGKGAAAAQAATVLIAS
jgi:hypothetical protein